MIDLSIAPELKSAVPKVAVGIVTVAVNVTQHDDRLWREIQADVDQISSQLTRMDEVRRLPPIRATWDAEAKEIETRTVE